METEKTTYYWEGTGRSCGTFEAESDEEAVRLKKPYRATLVYREGSTEDGTPFVVVWQASPSTEV